MKKLRYVALAEATSFLILIVFSVVKRTADNELGVQIMGPIHGLLFIAYVALTINVRSEYGWSAKTTFWILLGAVVPFGGYVADRWLLGEERRRLAPAEA